MHRQDVSLRGKGNRLLFPGCQDAIIGDLFGWMSESQRIDTYFTAKKGATGSGSGRVPLIELEVGISDHLVRL